MVSVTFAALLLYTSGQNDLGFEAPVGASEADFGKAAKALQVRCETYGYKGIVGSVVEKRIRLSSPTGFPEKMKKSTEALASLPCAKIELRFLYLLGPREKEQYLPGAAAPEGTTWVNLSEWETCQLDDRDGRWTDSAWGPFFRKAEKPKWALLRNSPSIEISSGDLTFLPAEEAKERQNSATKVFEITPGFDASLRFPPEISKKMKSMMTKDPDDGKETFPGILLIDGARMPTRGSLRWEKNAYRWAFDVLQHSVLPLCIKNPLPFCLKVVN